MADLALTMARLITALGLERVTLMGTSWGGTLALWLAVRQPERLDALVPEAPGAIRPEGPHAPPPTSRAARPPVVRPSRAALVPRLRGPNRDADLERRLPGLQTPTLVLFGPLDRMIPAGMGRVYRGSSVTATSCWSTMRLTKSALT